MTPKYKRILLKFSGETLGGEQGSGFDYDTIRTLAESVISVHNLNVEVGIVMITVPSPFCPVIDQNRQFREHTETARTRPHCLSL